MTIAAFFDVDGTMLPFPSLEKRYLRYLRWHGNLRWHCWLRAAAHMLPLAVRANWSWKTRDGGEAEWPVLIANNKSYLKDVPCWTMPAFCAWVQRYPLPIFPAARRRFEWHAERGHRIFLVTGAPSPLAEGIAQQLSGRVEILATSLKSIDGAFTGRIAGKAMAGIEKSRAVARLAARERFILSECFAYGDSFADRWLLARVGHPVAVNPSRALAHLARSNGWPIARWTAKEPVRVAVHPAHAPDLRFVDRLSEVAARHGCVVKLLAPAKKEPRVEPAESLEKAAV